MDISVTLRDAADGGVIARTTVPSEDLPPTFDGTQMLEAAGTVWRVVRAEPAFREEYELVGELELTLRQVERVERADLVPGGDIHFSMSSISDRLPDIAGPLDGRTVLLVKDDLWRDVELIGPVRGAPRSRRTWRRSAGSRPTSAPGPASPRSTCAPSRPSRWPA